MDEVGKWLAMAGLGKYAEHFLAAGIDAAVFKGLLLQDYGQYGVSSLEDKQKLFRLIKTLNSGAEPVDEQAELQSAGLQEPLSSLLAAESAAPDSGILDVHAMDDNLHAFQDDALPLEGLGDFVGEKSSSAASAHDFQAPHFPWEPLREAGGGKDDVLSSSKLARIRVVVRKRPINKKELAKKESDIVVVGKDGASLMLLEPKQKVDLTAFIEKHEFVFDAVLDELVNNDEVYRMTVQPLVETIFNGGRATCFAYGQTGSGKTYTMEPLPIRAMDDIVHIKGHPKYQNVEIWLSHFEIYGGKVFDLLNDRRKLCTREDGRQQVCIVGLKEHRVSSTEDVLELFQNGNLARSTGVTGANETSSRSHAILQLALKKSDESNRSKGARTLGKLSFIDLAGSERGADTYDNDKQTRLEGAEINKSLLALKECIRALDHEQSHIPFRGSKLTEVLRDSFTGDSRTVMVANVSPNSASCEHTLNTLRYADRVKGLSRSGRVSAGGDVGAQRGQNLPPPVPAALFPPGSYEAAPPASAASSSRGSKYSGRPTDSESAEAAPTDRRGSGRRSEGDAAHSNLYRPEARLDGPSAAEEACLRPAEPRGDSLLPVASTRPADRSQGAASRQLSHRPSTRPSAESGNGALPPGDRVATATAHEKLLGAILEEEEELISAHRRQIEDSMEIVREEMRLLAVVDQPGSHLDSYVQALSNCLSRKAKVILELQDRLARFEKHLREEEQLSKRLWWQAGA